MSATERNVYLNDIPRYSLGIVFLWFGIDKFLLHDFYLSWFSTTERARTLLPNQDLSLSIYEIGAIEIIFAALIFAGIQIRWVCIAVVAFLVLILLTAQYPSSYPQDIGLIGFAIVLILTNASWKKAQTQKLFRFLPILRYSISSVLFLWAIDHIINIDRHIGWFQLASPIEFIPSNELKLFFTLVIFAEIILAVLIASGKISITKFSLIASTIFFLFAWLVLDPPANNHQTISLALVSAWLTYIAFTKNRI
jgi:uncharacterized membrane protein YphA (DoxX/SURF4 family)